MFEQLSGLVRDAAWFKSYMAAALLVMKESMQVRACMADACMVCEV